MPPQWKPAHLDLGDLLGFGGLGEVWRARDAQGQDVVLRRVGRVEPAALRELRRLATVVRSLPTPHLVRLRRCLGDGSERVLVMDSAPTSLAALLAARGRLSPGEVVTALAPVAQTLALAHAHDLAHGRVTLSAVLLTAQGMPLLDGLGLEPLRPAGDQLDVTDPALRAADVRAVGLLCVQLLTGVPGQEPPMGPLAAVVASALSARPPAAGDLAAALLGACPPAPLLGLTEGDQPPRPHRRDLRPALLAGAALVALLAVVAAGWAWGRTGPGAVQVAAVTTDWRAVLDGLDARRADAFATADPDLLEQVWSAGSPAGAQDRASVTALRADRRTAVGVRHVVSAASPLSAAQQEADRVGRVELAVVERLGPQQLTAGSRVVGRRPGSGEVRCTVVLVRGPGGWRIAEVRPL